MAFFQNLWHYAYEVFPALVIGLLISGVVHQFAPENLVKKYLGRKGLVPILAATLTGILLPVCCIGSLPIAISFYKKGAKLGPTLAFLVATPATSITAVIVSVKMLGILFTLYLGVGVIFLGLLLGVIGNMLHEQEHEHEHEDEAPPCCQKGHCIEHVHEKPLFWSKITLILKYAFITMPKDFGLEIAIGLIIAAIIASFAPIGTLIKTNLSGFWGFPFSLVFGLIMYVCSTASVPLVHAFTQQGMDIGAGMILLLAGPITSYGALLVVRKHFGTKVLAIYITVISLASLLLGISYSVIFGKLENLLPAWML